MYKTLDNFGAIGNWIGGLLKVLTPFVIGILIAYILYIPTKKIENLYSKVKKPKIIAKKARTLAVFTVYAEIVDKSNLPNKLKYHIKALLNKYEVIHNAKILEEQALKPYMKKIG